MERRWAGAVAGLVLMAQGALARVNVLEPWSPGFDAAVTDKKFDHSLSAQVGEGGVDGVDMTGLAYTLTVPWGRNWEFAGGWGVKSLDSSGVRDGSGVTDLGFAAKCQWPKSWMGASGKGVWEFGLTLPTGNPDNGIGAGGLGVLGNAGIVFPLRSVRGYGQIGAKFYTESSGTRWGNVFNYSVGAMYPVHPEWMVSADMRVLSHGKDKIDGVRMSDSTQEAYLAPGGVWRPEDLPFEAQGLLLLGLTGDAYDFGLQLGVRF